nr:uncharacterized protein LOC132598269 [Globicephala melas]
MYLLNVRVGSAERSAAWHPGTRKGTRDPRRNPGGGGGGRERRGWGARCSLRSFSHARARRWSRAAGFPDYGIRELKQRGRLPARSGCGKLRWRISKERGRYPGSRRRQLPLPTPAEAGTGAGWWRSKETLKPLGTHLPIGRLLELHPGSTRIGDSKKVCPVLLETRAPTKFIKPRTEPQFLRNGSNTQPTPHLPASPQSRGRARGERGGQSRSSGRARSGGLCLRPGSHLARPRPQGPRSLSPSLAAPIPGARPGPGTEREWAEGRRVGGRGQRAEAQRELPARAPGLVMRPRGVGLARPRRQAASPPGPRGFVCPARRTFASGRKASSAI